MKPLCTKRKEARDPSPDVEAMGDYILSESCCKKQVTTRPGIIWPEEWSIMSKM